MVSGLKAVGTIEHTAFVSCCSAESNLCHCPVPNRYLQLFDCEWESAEIHYEEYRGLTAPRRPLLNSPLDLPWFLVEE